jgi:hypothetical protein
MAMTETGADDHFTKIADKDIAMIPISNRSGMGIVGLLASIKGILLRKYSFY